MAALPSCSLFPHRSTAERFFAETQFEAHRALGYHAASRAAAEWSDLPEGAEMKPEERVSA